MKLCKCSPSIALQQIALTASRQPAPSSAGAQEISLALKNPGCLWALWLPLEAAWACSGRFHVPSGLNAPSTVQDKNGHLKWRPSPARSPCPSMIALR